MIIAPTLIFVMVDASSPIISEAAAETAILSGIPQLKDALETTANTGNCPDRPTDRPEPERTREERGNGAVTDGGGIRFRYVLLPPFLIPLSLSVAVCFCLQSVVCTQNTEWQSEPNFWKMTGAASRRWLKIGVVPRMVFQSALS